MTEDIKEPTQELSKAERIAVAKARAAERVKRLLKGSKKDMGEQEGPAQIFKTLKTAQKDRMTREEHARLLAQRLVYIAPRESILRLLQAEGAKA